eukprot:TRINITY_DN22095_c0_g1_i1.p1 TRINITY_DN22095_c0_g1~~TRINITY_DN22095_c0_g1_i1.p1  ORF type:complete len:231 (+),score=60.81 TRINITY_DN22095_c0_g1_i1:103-693(+)
MALNTSVAPIVALTLIAWILGVVATATPGGLMTFTTSAGRYTYTAKAGLFRSTAGSQSGDTELYDCHDGARKAACAFAVIGLIFIGVAMIYHILELVGVAGSLPPVIGANMKWAHIVGGVCGLITWVCMVIAFAAECEISSGVNHKYSKNGDPGFGIFLWVAVMIMEFIAFFLASKGGGASFGGSGGAPYTMHVNG